MGSEARARVGLGGLLLLTLFSFGQVFENDDYVGPGLLAMLLGVALAMLCRRLGAAPWLTIWVSLAALGWYLIIVFQAANTLYGLPTPAAAAGVNRAVARALEASQVDYAPVPMRPGYIILTVVGAWVCALLGEVATFRWRRPLLASLGPIALFALLVVVGDGTGAGLLVLLFLSALLTYWGLEASHRLRSWGRWMGAWTSAIDEGESVTGRVARRMGLSALAAALVAPAIVPALGNGLLAWRSGTGEGPGIGQGGGSPSPIVDVKPQLIRQSGAELFEVRAAEPTYWRLVSLSEFDGRYWQEGDAPRTTLDDVTIDDAEPLGALDQTLEQSFDLVGLGGPYLPAAVRPTSIEGIDPSAIQINADTLQLEAGDGDVEGESYSVRSAVTDLTYRKLAEAEAGRLSDEWFERYTALPDDVPQRVFDLAEAWTQGIASDFEKLVTLQRRFQSGEFVYDLRAPEPRTDEYLTEFLFDTKRGYCQQFATAFGVLARALNFPTRVSVGFLPGTPDPEEANLYTVTGKQTHAWPEVYFEDYGWVRFEPTPRAISPQLSYTIAPTSEGGLPNNFAGANALGLQQSLGEPVPGSGSGRECRRLARRLQETCERQRAGGAEAFRELERSRGREDYAWQQTFKTISRSLIAATLLFLLFVPLLKEGLVKRRYRRARDPRGAAAAAFAQFLDDAAELAEARAPSESAIAYVERLGRAGQVSRETSRRLALLYEQAEYSLRGIDGGQARDARRLAGVLRRGMWNRASSLKRIRRLFSPTRLTGRRAPHRRRLALRPRAATRSLG